MEPYQQRVVEEKKALDEKIEKLHSFTVASTFKNMPMIEQDALYKQLTIMNQYSAILQERINRF